MKRSRCIAAAPGAGIVVLVTVLAVALGNRAVFVPLLVIGPLVAAVLAPARCTAGVAVLAVACAIPLGLADDDLLSAEHLGEIAAVAAGGALAVIAAAGRRRYEEALRRSEFAARTGRLLEAPPEPEAMLQEIVRLAVPEMAQLCTVDLVEDSELGATVAHADDPRTLEMLFASRERYPLDAAGPHPVAVVARTGRPHLQREMGPERLRAFAVDEQHLQLMTGPGYASSLAVPLVARGRTIGVLSFLRFGGSAPYTDDDATLAGEVALRAALALDNARLFAELRRTEGQLEAVLANLAAAVTVQAPDGSLVYVNQAGAEVLGCASPEEALTTPLAELVGRFVVLDEGGRPYDMRDLPGRHALAGRDPRPALTHSIDRRTGAERWAVTKATPVLDEHGEVVLAVNIIEDVTEARRAERQQRFLSAASALVSSSLDTDLTLAEVAGAAVPELADWCVVEVPDQRGAMRRAAAAGDVPDAVDESAALTAPMTAGGRTVGRILLGTTHSARRLGEDERTLAEELGRRAGIAVEHARLHATRTHIATTLQRSLLPPRLPLVPGLTVAARFRAAGETSDVGGDFYDLFPIGGAWMVVVGDVTGKGPAAATITSLARYTMRTAAMYERSPAAVLARLNAALGADPERRQLCTAVCVRIEPGRDGMAATVARGGHPAPVLVRAGGGIEAVGSPGPLLGVFDTGAWEEHLMMLATGDSLVLYTDGVTDTRGGDGELFGHERLDALLRGAAGLDADEIAARIDESLQAFQLGEQRDDVALLVLRVGGGDAQAYENGSESATSASDGASRSRWEGTSSPAPSGHSMPTSGSSNLKARSVAGS